MSATAARARLVDIGEVARMLAARVDGLVRELLPYGRRDGHEWRVGSLAGEKGDSLGVHLGGAKAGVWRDFAANEGGDALDLVAQVLFRGDKAQALRWSLRWLGLEGGDAAALETARRAIPSAEEVKRKSEEETQSARNAARRIWLAAQPSVLDTPVERYLVGRGISLRDLGRQPRAIRYQPALWHQVAGRHFPAMVTAITGEAPGGFASVHRTWLQEHPDGTVTKAPLGKDAKKCLGQYMGGHIALWRGASGKSLREAPEGETLDITEGIEDGLSVAYAAPECRVIAAVSLSNMGSLVLPPQIRTVRLWRQNDTKREAIAAFDRVVRAHLAAGRQVEIPAVPREVKDVNDLLTSGGGEA